MSEPRKLVHSIELDVRWGDMDALGHVNNTVYFRYFEQARIGWLETMGHAIEEGDTGPVAINARCTFLRPIYYPDRLDVRIYVGPPGRSSFETYYEIRRAGTQAPLYAEGATKLVWTHYADGRSIPLPEDMRQLLTP